MAPARTAKPTRRLIATVLAAASLSGAAHADPRGVIELFTSQGCSSCPPADAVLATMARQPDLITLTLPVDYWDRLGWKDTLAKHAFTERQYAYAGARGDGRIYTPQAVINGQKHVVGSSRSDIDAAVASTASSFAVPVHIARRGQDLVVSVGAGASAGSGNVVLMPLIDARKVPVGRGENARRTLTYTNIVREIVPIAAWTGVPLEHTVSAAQFKDYDSIVALLQKGSPRNPGAILGAARTDLR
jgi:hypothetical protein